MAEEQACTHSKHRLRGHVGPATWSIWLTTPRPCCGKTSPEVFHVCQQCMDRRNLSNNGAVICTCGARKGYLDSVEYIVRIRPQPS